MKYSFARTGKVDPREWEVICREMRATLDEAEVGKFTQEEFAEFFRQAIRDGWPLPHNSEMVFWNFDLPETMPSDARCDFVYRPTYLIVCTMIVGINRYPELFNLCGIRDTLARGLCACTGRGLEGHGYDATATLYENLRLFLGAGVQQFLDTFSNLCPEFTKLFNDTFEMIRDAYENGCHISDWERNFKEEQEELLKLYDAAHRRK